MLHKAALHFGVVNPSRGAATMPFDTCEQRNRCAAQNDQPNSRSQQPRIPIDHISDNKSRDNIAQNGAGGAIYQIQLAKAQAHSDVAGHGVVGDRCQGRWGLFNRGFALGPEGRAQPLKI